MSSYESKSKPLNDMDKERLKWFLAILPKIPLIARVALYHVLQLSAPSKYLDLRSEIIVAVIRSFLTPSAPRSISSTQKLASRDPGIKGRIWVSNYTAPAPPEPSVREALVKAIEALQSKKAEVRLPEILPVEAEWTGYRAGATPNSRLPSISEEEKYAEMMKECGKPTTILYFHGGAYWMLDPATHRPTTKKLAKLTKGRCYSVRYRLAPQNPFPAALLDALISYLALLYPPPGAFHQPVRPEHIVFAGDSAGGNLALALLQTLLEFRRQDIKIAWFGEVRTLPLPAGVAVDSPWMDITHSSPSWETNAAYDILPTPLSMERSKPRPPCSAWPANPPRKTFYADDSFVIHPLVTLLMAPSWASSPPVFVCTGWELLADEDKYTAAKLHRDGVPVVFEEYEGMPHCFALILTELEGSKRCVNSWAAFIARAVEDPAGIKSSFTSIKAKTLEEVEIDPVTVSPYTEEEVRERIYQRIGREPAKKPAKEDAAKL